MGISAAYTSERLYAEWFSWVVNAMPGLSKDTYHHTAQAAVTAARTGADPQSAALEAAHTDTTDSWATVSDGETRRYAEWYEWARQSIGGSPEMTHAAAAAATARAIAGQPPEASMAAAREAAEIVVNPPVPIWAGPVRAVTESSPESMGIARDPLRIALLLILAPFPYNLWFLWQVFALGRQDGFPRARSFWWTLVPFYGLWVLYQVLDDLYEAERRRRGHSSLIPPLIIGLIFVSGIVERISSGLAGLVFFAAGAAIFAIAGFLTQTSMTRYLTGDDRPGFMANVSIGETVAAVLGLSVSALVVAGTLLLALDPALGTQSAR